MGEAAWRQFKNHPIPMDHKYMRIRDGRERHNYLPKWINGERKTIPFTLLIYPLLGFDPAFLPVLCSYL